MGGPARARLSLKGRAIQWLAGREHSRVELRKKLLARLALEARQARLVQAASGAVTRAAARHRDGGHDDHDGDDGDDGTGSVQTGVAGAAELDRGVDVDARVDAHALRALQAQEIDALLDDLSALGYLSDQRFVESRLRTRASRQGNQRIRIELARHGVNVDAAQRQSLTDSEPRRAYDLWCRRFGGVRAEAPGQRAKEMRFLANRGFSTDLVRRVVDGRFTPLDFAVDGDTEHALDPQADAASPRAGRDKH